MVSSCYLIVLIGVTNKAFHTIFKDWLSWIVFIKHFFFSLRTSPVHFMWDFFSLYSFAAHHIFILHTPCPFYLQSFINFAHILFFKESVIFPTLSNSLIPISVYLSIFLFHFFLANTTHFSLCLFLFCTFP